MLLPFVNVPLKVPIVTPFSRIGSPKSKRSLVRALADSGTVSPAFRNRITGIFAEVLKDDSALAMEIAIAMRDWNETQLDDQLSALLDTENIDPVTQFIIQTKLAPKG